MTDHDRMTNHEKDQDLSKGVVERQSREHPTDVSMQGQLGHRDQDPLIKSADTDFPEPGSNPEHSGEPTENETQTQKDDAA